MLFRSKKLKSEDPTIPTKNKGNIKCVPISDIDVYKIKSNEQIDYTEEKEFIRQINELFKKYAERHLTERNIKIVSDALGLDGKTPISNEELAEKYSLHPQTIKTIIDKFIAMLVRNKMIIDYFMTDEVPSNLPESTKRFIKEVKDSLMNYKEEKRFWFQNKTTGVYVTLDELNQYLEEGILKPREKKVLDKMLGLSDGKQREIKRIARDLYWPEEGIYNITVDINNAIITRKKGIVK